MNAISQLCNETKQTLTVISKDKNLVKSLIDDDLYYIVIDDLKFLSNIVLDDVLSKNKCAVLINLYTNTTNFKEVVTNHILTYFDDIQEFKNVILCDDPYTFDIAYMDRISKYGRNNIISHADLLYVGQSGISGYATAAKGYIADYVLRGINVAWKPLYFDNSKDDDAYYVDAIAKSRKIDDFVNKSFDQCILHCTPDLWRGWYNTFVSITENISGYTVWETDKLPDKWVKYINYLDKVMVPSTFNKEVFIDSGVKSEISVVPHIFHKEALPKRKNVVMYDCVGNMIPTDRYTFYCIGEYHTRKGINDLVSIFDKIGDNNDVQLVIKTHYKHNTEKDKYNCYKNIKSISSKLGKNIYLILNELNHNEMCALHSLGDCYVSLNKGEGFGLTIHDAFNYGKNVITTGYGGPVDYLPSNMLIDYKLDKVTGMKSFSENYTEDQNWAYPDLDHALEMIRGVL